MSTATQEDAVLLVQLTQLGVSSGVMEAAHKLFRDDFDPATADASDPEIAKILGHYELVGTLTKNGLLDHDLVKDLWWVEGLWDRVGAAAKRQRDRHQEPRLYENFEALATS